MRRSLKLTARERAIVLEEVNRYVYGHVDKDVVEVLAVIDKFGPHLRLARQLGALDEAPRESYQVDPDTTELTHFLEQRIREIDETVACEARQLATGPQCPGDVAQWDKYEAQGREFIDRDLEARQCCRSLLEEVGR